MLKRHFAGVMPDQHGATSVEYALILALIFLAIVAAATGVGETTANLFNNVASDVADAS